MSAINRKKRKPKLPNRMIKLLKLMGIRHTKEDKMENSEEFRDQQIQRDANTKARNRKANKVGRASRKANRGATSLQAWQLLQIMFVGLKLASVIDWSWWWVMSPMMIAFACNCIIAASVECAINKKAKSS